MIKYCVQLYFKEHMAHGPYTDLVPKTSKRVKHVECTISLMDEPVMMYLYYTVSIISTAAGLKDDNEKPVKQSSSHQGVCI